MISERRIFMRLTEAITIRNTTFKNRVMFPPLTTGYEDRNGTITEQDIAFYTRLAEGGAGYIVIGDVAPIQNFTPTPRLFDDAQIESFRKLADSVHVYGAKLGIQIFHPEYDCETMMRLFAEGKMDEVRTKLHHDMMHFVDEVSEEMLLSIIDKMCACAVRAEKAGVDVIQIHGDRLVGALCSTKMNHRTDKFGGSLENRTRFALLLVEALRKAVPDMIIDYKFSVVTPERGKGGIDEADAPEFAKMLEAAGVDMLHVAQANHTGNMADTIPPMGVQPYGFFADISGKVKEAVSIPVSTVGRIISPAMAEQILASGKADMVGIGRGLLADPDWTNKAAAGKSCDIRECISCNKGCTDKIQHREFLSCILNAENGYEGTRKITPAESPKHIVIVGGGVAGMEAARVAVKKGHKVTLFEQKISLGGQLEIASVPPRKEEMRRFTNYLSHCMKQEGITLRLGEAATPEKILDLKPDHVIVAAGANSARFPINGMDRACVCDAWDVLSGKTEVYGRTAVIGGGMVGCETAEYLAERGCSVSVIEMLDKIAAGESETILPTLKENYERFGVKEYPSHKVEKIQESSVICKNKEDEKVVIDCDFVVLAMGARPVAFDTAFLDEAGIPFAKIGDCGERASDISNAVRTAYDTVNAIR